MPITGLTLWRNIQQKSDQAYTDYFDTTKANRLLYDAYIMAIQQVYRSSDKDFQKEAISSLTSTNKSYSVNNNQIYTAPLQIIDVAYSGLVVTITTQLPHNILANQTFTIADVAGVSGVNGLRTASIVTANTITFSVSFAPSGTYTARTGIVTYDNMIDDYWHVLSLKAQFTEKIYDLNITRATNTTPISIRLNKRSNVRAEKLSIRGVTGNTAANGEYYLKPLNYFDYAIYTDQNFQNPVAGSGAYVSGGNLWRSYYNYCKPVVSDTKIGVLNRPNTFDPGYELADGLIKIWPLESQCSEVTIDYIKKPYVTISTTDDTTDLLLYYSNDFLLMVQDTASKLFGEYARDQELINISSIENQIISK